MVCSNFHSTRVCKLCLFLFAQFIVPYLQKHGNVGGLRRFQSTHPARGATLPCCAGNSSAQNFNPRTPRGVRRSGSQRKTRKTNFNPRTPRGVRRTAKERSRTRQRFQSTHPARGATSTGEYGGDADDISIHAPREGCDIIAGHTRYKAAKFQSTHPARGATRCDRQPPIFKNISTHAPREGCDCAFAVL